MCSRGGGFLMETKAQELFGKRDGERKMRNILMHCDAYREIFCFRQSSEFYKTLRYVLDNLDHSLWNDEDFVCWVATRAWGGRFHYIEQTFCRQCLKVPTIMRHRKAIDVIINTLGRSRTLYVVDRMATYLLSMQKIDSAVFSESDCSKMAEAVSRLDSSRIVHARIIKRIERICAHVLHPSRQDFAREVREIFSDEGVGE